MTTEIKISELEKLPNHELSMLAMFALGLDVKKRFCRTTYDRHIKSLRKSGYDLSRQIVQKTISTKSLDVASMKYL